MNIIYVYSLKTPYLINSKYWINYFIEKGANDYHRGFKGACQGRHLEIVNLMIEKGVDNWNYGLYEVCRGGHLDIVNLMIEKGADVNRGLQGACEGGHLEIVNLMIEKGAKPRKEYQISFKIPKYDLVIKVIYASLYDYLPDEMINIILQYSIVEDFNLIEWLQS